MKTKLIISIVAGGLALVSSGALHAAGGEENDMEARLREGMRSLAMQLRTVQGERDTAIAKQAELEQKIQGIEEQVKTLTKNSAADKETMDSLKARITEKDKVITELQAGLEKSRNDYGKVLELAKKLEAEKAEYRDKAIVLERQVADQQRRNLEMHKIGKEILGRYEKFGLGTAITAREPFVGLTRVKLENLVQDYSDKLDEQRIKPE